MKLHPTNYTFIEYRLYKFNHFANFKNWFNLVASFLRVFLFNVQQEAHLTVKLVLYTRCTIDHLYCIQYKPYVFANGNREPLLW